MVPRKEYGPRNTSIFEHELPDPGVKFLRRWDIILICFNMIWQRDQDDFQYTPPTFLETISQSLQPFSQKLIIENVWVILDARNVNFGGKAPSVFSDIGSPQICHPVSLDKWSWRSREFRPDFPVASVAKMGSFARKIPVDSCGFTFLLPGVPMASSHSTTADFHGAFL